MMTAGRFQCDGSHINLSRTIILTYKFEAAVSGLSHEWNTHKTQDQTLPYAVSSRPNTEPLLANQQPGMLHSVGGGVG